jgi:hypothetical protein
VDELEPESEVWTTLFYFLKNSGSFAIFAAIRCALSLLINFAAERRPRLTLIIDIAQRLIVGVTHDETVRRYLGGPRRWEAAARQRSKRLSLLVDDGVFSVRPSK